MRTTTALLVHAIALIAPGISRAETSVYVQNNTAREFTLTIRSDLAPKFWRSGAARVAPGARARVVTFNRDEGVTNGRQFVFDESLATAGRSFTLRQRLTGKLIGSRLEHTVQGEPWHDDRETRRATWQGGGLGLQVKFRAYFTGTDDDVEYVIQEAAPAAASEDDHALQVLAYNVYLRPTTLFKNGQQLRAGLLPARLQGHDVLVLCEAFADEARSRLLAGLRPAYPHATRVVGTDRGLEQDGGVVIVSRWPIEAQAQRRFEAVSRGPDALADKGVLYARIRKGSMRYHVFGTHLQADNEHTRDVTVRAEQLQVIRRFVDDQHISASEPVVVAGDLNIDMHAAGQDEYRRMLASLSVAHPTPEGLQHSFDPTTNQLASGSASRRQLLDYVLTSSRHLQPLRATNEVLLVRADEEWKEFGFERAVWDLSDHHAVLARLEFPPR